MPGVELIIISARSTAADPAAKKAATAFPADRRHRFSWGLQNHSLERPAARSGARRHFGHINEFGEIGLDHSTRMVFILRDMEPSFIDALWQTLTELVEPGAATCANPLAVTKGGLPLEIVLPVNTYLKQE